MSSSFNLVANLQFQMASGQLTGLYSQLESALKPIKFDLGLGNLQQQSANVRNLAAATGSLQAGMKAAGSSTSVAANQISAFGKVTVDATGFLENLATGVGLTARRFLAFTVASTAMIGFGTAIKSTLSQGVSFEKQMLRISQVSGESRQAVQNLQEEITNLSVSLGTSSKSLADVALILKQAGLSAKETALGLRAVAEADLSGGFGSQTEIVEGLIAAYRQFNIQAKDFGSTLGSIGAVANSFAVESRDLVVAIKAVGGTAAASGTSLNELLAIFTSIRGTTRESAESIATGLRTILTRLNRSDTIDLLKEFQINLRYTAEESQRLAGDRSLENQFIGSWNALQRLSEGLRNLPTTDPRFSMITEALGGYRQISKVIPALQQFSEAERARSVAIAGGVTNTIASIKAQESLANQFDKTKEQWLSLGRSIVGSNSFQTLAKDALSLANGLVKVVEFSKPLLPLFASLATVRLFQGLGPAFRNAYGAFNAQTGSSVVPSVMSNPRPRGYSSGGRVSGIGTHDTELAYLTPGEYVLNRRAAQMIGHDELHRINSTGRVQRFASGGPVGTTMRLDQIKGSTNPNVVALIPQIEELFKKLGKSVYDFSEVVVKVTKKTAQLVGVPGQGTVEERLRVRKPAILGEEIRNQLLSQNPNIGKYIAGKSGLRGRMGGDDEATQEGMAYAVQMARRFDPSKSKNENVRAAAARGDWADPELNKAFRGSVIRASLTKAQREAAKRERLGAVDATEHSRDQIGKSSDYHYEDEQDELKAMKRRGKRGVVAGSVQESIDTANAQYTDVTKPVPVGDRKRLLERMRRKRAGLPDEATSSTVNDQLAGEQFFSHPYTKSDAIPWQGPPRPEIEGYNFGTGHIEHGWQGPPRPDTPTTDFSGHKPATGNDWKLRHPTSSAGWQGYQMVPFDNPDPTKSHAYSDAPWTRVFNNRGSYAGRDDGHRASGAYNVMRPLLPVPEPILGTNALTNKEKGYQDSVLAAALAEQKRRGRAASKGGVDPLSIPQDQRYTAADRKRLADLKQAQSVIHLPPSAVAAARYYDSGSGGGTIGGGPGGGGGGPGGHGPRGPGFGTTDPLKLKEMLMRAVQGDASSVPANFNIGDEMARAKTILSPAQMAQVQKAYARAGGNTTTVTGRSLPQTGGLATTASSIVQKFAADQVSERINQRGGAVSQGTRDQLTQSAIAEQTARVAKQILEAEEAILQKLFPQVNATERTKMARENVAKAIEGQEKTVGGSKVKQFEDVVRDASGKILGTQTSVGLATAKQISTTGGAVSAEPVKGTNVNDLIGQLASTQVDARIASMGGRVSKQTLGSLTDNAVDQQRARISKQLLDAETEVLKKTMTGVSIAEIRLIAGENIARAMQGQERIIQGQNGRILGTERSVANASAMGISATGQTRWQRAGGWVNDQAQSIRGGVSGGIGRVGRFVGRINERLSGLSGFATPAVAMTLPYASMGFDRLAGDADMAARGGQAGADRHSNYRGLSGATSGAIVGGTLGFAAGGPLGMLLGAGAGGIVGFVTAAKEAEQDIRKIKIGQAISEFSDNLTYLTNQLSGNSPLEGGTLGRIQESFTTANTQINRHAQGEATGYFGNFNVGEYAAARSRGIRDNFSGQLGPIMQVLSREAARLGRTNINGSSVDQLQAQLVGGNGGVNRTLLSTAAAVRGVAPEDIIRELRREIVNGQHQGQSERENRRGNDSETRTTANWSRLSFAMQSASDGLDRLRDQSRVLADAFEGVSSPIHVNAGANRLNALGRSDSAFVQPLSLIRNIGGEAGQGLYQSGQAVDSIARVLPGVLSNIASRNLTEGSDVTTSTQTGVAQALGYTVATLPAHLREQLDMAIRNLNHTMEGGRGPGGFIDDFKADPTKFVEHIMGPQANALRQAAGDMLRNIEQASNGFIDGLQRVSRATNQIAELMDRGTTVRMQGERARLEFAADRNYQGGRVLDFTTLAQMEAPLQARQERLTGLHGDAANDPMAIGGLLANLRGAVRSAEANQATVFGRTSGQGPEFRAAAEEVVNMRDRAANAALALQHLGNTAERTAAPMERLGRLTQERDARRGLGERFIGSDSAGRAQIIRSAMLANQAVRSGSLDRLPIDAQGQVLQFLRSAGRATLNLGGERRTGDDFASMLIDRSAGGMFGLDNNQQDEMRTLQETIANRFQAAEAAINQLTTDLTRDRDLFFTNLNSQHERFFSTLAQVFLNRERVAQTTNEVGRAGTTGGELNQLAAHRTTLAAFGVTDDATLGRFNSSRGDFQALAEATNRQDALSNRARTASAAVGDNIFSANEVSAGPVNTDRILGFLSSQGINGEQARRVIQSFTGQTERAAADPRDDDYLPSGRLSGAARARMLRAAINAEVGAGSEMAGHSNEITRVSERLQGIFPGINIRGVASTLGGPNGQQVFRAADAFQNRPDGVTLGNLTERMAAARTEFDRLTVQLRTLNDVLAAMERVNGVAQAVPGHHALGGRVRYAAGGWEPRGTDTQPAMLTPGEWVVNRRSSEANHGLLQAINNANGPLMLAVGGQAPELTPQERQLRLFGRQNPFGESGLTIVERDARANAGNIEPHLRNRQAVRALNPRVISGSIQNLVTRQTLANSRVHRADSRTQISNQMANYTSQGHFNAEAARHNTTLQSARSDWYGVRGFSSGGVVGGVRYMAGGGSTAPSEIAPPAIANQGGTSDFATSSSQLTVGMRVFSESANSLRTALNSFAGHATALGDAMNKIPRQLEIKGEHHVVVTMNGAEVLTRLMPEIERIVMDRTKSEINRVFSNHMPEAGVTA